MSQRAILAKLRAMQKTTQRRACETLRSGLGIEARESGQWLLWRDDVKPSDQELEMIARDADMGTGFSVKTEHGKGSSRVYRLLTPCNDGEAFTQTLCPNCQKRSLVRDPTGGADYCLECGYGTSDYAQNEREAEFAPRVAKVEVIPEPEPAQEAPPRADLRPGSPLPEDFYLEHGRAFGAVWTARREYQREGGEMLWAAL
jgi:hypothetical protein